MSVSPKCPSITRAAKGTDAPKRYGGALSLPRADAPFTESAADGEAADPHRSRRLFCKVTTRGAQDPRRRPAAQSGAVSAVRLSLHVDAACAGTLLEKGPRPGHCGHGLPHNALESPALPPLGGPRRLILGLPSDCESANSRRKVRHCRWNGWNALIRSR